VDGPPAAFIPSAVRPHSSHVTCAPRSSRSKRRERADWRLSVDRRRSAGTDSPCGRLIRRCRQRSRSEPQRPAHARGSGGGAVPPARPARARRAVLRQAEHEGHGELESSRGARHRVGSGPAGAAFETGEPAPGPVAPSPSPVHQAAGDLGLDLSVAVPALHADEVLAVLELFVRARSAGAGRPLGRRDRARDRPPPRRTAGRARTGRPDAARTRRAATCVAGPEGSPHRGRAVRHDAHRQDPPRAHLREARCDRPHGSGRDSAAPRLHRPRPRGASQRRDQRRLD
jgi:hypothetical protein